MKLSRPSRLFAACLALVSLLFMQLAVASYVCPEMPTENVIIEMPGCTGMDTDQPALCHAHAQGDLTKQTLDKPPLPDVQPFAMTGAAFIAQLIERDSVAHFNAPRSIALTRTTAPPINIRNCCFRI